MSHDGDFEENEKDSLINKFYTEASAHDRFVR
jgi:hypothetical protein